MTDFYGWSSTAADNATADSTINWAEFQDPSTVNDSARALMARVSQWRRDLAPMRSSAGSSNAYTVSSDAGGSGSYRDGEIVTFIADRANTSSCTLNVNSRGAKAFRPAIGVEFTSGEIRANQPIIAFYRSSSEEWLAVGSGYHVTAMTTGLLSQSIAARLIKIGTPVLSLAPSAPAGYIRLTEATQTLNKSDWPELNTWLSSISYPWGSASTTFNLPPAAGYVLRFAATSSSIDTAGARTAGSTQTDAVAAHTHAAGTLATASDGAHTHTVTSVSGSAGGAAGATGYNIVTTGSQTTSSSGAHTHTISGSTASAGSGTETRPKNVAMHVDVFASSTLSAGTLAMFGFPFAWDSGTSAADPGTARVRGNHATLSSITALYISETDAWGVGIGTVLSGIQTGSVIRLSKVGAQANTLIMTVSGSITDNGTYRTIPVTISGSNGSFSNDDSLAFELAGGAGIAGTAATIAVGNVTTGSAGSSASVTNTGSSSAAVFNFAIPRGDTGAAGAAGTNGTDAGIRWTFSSTTSMADPTTGKIRLNHSSFSSVTALAVADNCAESGNPNVVNWVLAWDDSTTTALRGTLIIKKPSAPQNFAIYNITGSNTDNSGWTEIAVTHVQSDGSFSDGDTLSVVALRTGNAGAGSGDFVGPASSVDGELVLFDGVTGKLGKRASTTGILKGASGVLSAAAAGTDYVAPGGALGTPSSGTLTNATGLPISTGVSGLGTGVAASLAVNVGSAGAPVVLNGAGGTPSSLTLTNATGLPISTGVSGLGTGVATFLATPSSANLAAALTDETGTGAAVFANSPTLVTPALGTPSAINLTNGTALPVSGITSSTSTALGVGSLELGHASDTTLARSAAGEVTIEGTLVKKVGKETIWIPAAAMTARTTAGAAAGTAEMSTNRNMFSTLDFDTTTQEFAQFEIHMPKSWNLGTVTFQPVWSHASTTTNFGVVWGLAAVARSDDDAGDVAFGTAQTSTDTGGTTNDIYIGPESSAITIAGTPAAGDTVQFQIARNPSDGSDTMAIDARLHGVRVFFTSNASTDA